MNMMENSTLSFHEEDVIKLILEFLSTRHYHVTMRTLEKESGVINCDYSDEVLFLRDLVMDGDFEEIIQFGNSFMGSPTFDQKRFNFLVLKQKYIELIYTKSHIIGKQTYNIVEDVMKTLSELKCYCSTKEEYSDFCWLLTVPNLNSLDQFKNWSLDLSRLRCFEELLDCLSSFMPLVKKKITTRPISTNDRLLHLIVKGLFYESCIEYCQAIGSGDAESLSNNDLFKRDLLKSKFDDYSSNLLSWVLCLPHEAFVTPFQQMDVDIRLNRLVKKANITNSLDVTSVLKTKTSNNILSLSQSLNEQDAAKKKAAAEASNNKNFEILNKPEQSPLAKFHQQPQVTAASAAAPTAPAPTQHQQQQQQQKAVPEPLNNTFTRPHKMSNNDANNKKNDLMNSKNGSIYSNGSSDPNSEVDSLTKMKKSPLSMSLVIKELDEHEENGDYTNGQYDEEKLDSPEDAKIENAQPTSNAVESGASTPSHPNLSFFIPIGDEAQKQQQAQQQQQQQQQQLAEEPQIGPKTYTKDMKEMKSELTSTYSATFTRPAKSDVAPTYTKETLPDPHQSRDIKSDMGPPSILPEDRSSVGKSPLTPSITTSPGLSRKKKGEFFSPSSNRSSTVRSSTSTTAKVDVTKKSPEETKSPVKKGPPSESHKDHKEAKKGETQRKRSDSYKDSKKSESSPKKGHQSGDEESTSVVTSTPKSKRNDRQSFPPISPLKKKLPDNDERPGVEQNGNGVKSDVSNLIDVNDLPIGYYETGKENNLPSQPGVQLGPVINGVRRPISKTIPSQPPPQVNNADDMQEKFNPIQIEQPPEQHTPTQPILKGAGPKIKMKDGSKVHLKELMKAKDTSSVSSNYQLSSNVASDIQSSNDVQLYEEEDTQLSYTIERSNELSKQSVDERGYNKHDENSLKSIDDRASYKSIEPKESLHTKRSGDVTKHIDDDRILKYTPVSILEDTQAVRAVSFHPEGGIYAIGANSKMLRICDMAMNGTNRDSDGLPPMTVLFKRCKYHRGSIYCMDWSPDGRLLATGSNDKSIKILQFDAHQFTQTGEDIELNFHNGTVRELAFVPNKSGLLISGGTGDGSINITDTITQKIVGTLNGHTGNVMSVYAGVDLVATGGTDNAVRLWDLRSRRCIDVVIVGESCPASVTLSGSDKYLASGQEDGSILLYDLTAGRTLENFRLHQSDCRSARFSLDSNYLLTSSYDCNVTLMHLLKKTEMASPKFYNVAKHSDKVIQCRWHPTENMFLSSSADKTSILWKSIT